MNQDFPVDELYERDWESLSELRDEFNWSVPGRFNAVNPLCDDWARKKKDHIALYYNDLTQNREGSLTFGDVRSASALLAGYLRDQGVCQGNFVAVNLPRKPETIVAHLAIWRLGAVSVPLSVLLGPEGLTYRLSDCDLVAGIVDRANLDNFRTACDRIDRSLDRIIVGEAFLRDDETSYSEALNQSEPVGDIANTNVKDPMLLMYSSGTTGKPKGIIQPHRAVIGHLPGAISNYYNLDFRADEIWWTPSDWAWGAFLSMFIDAFYFGRPVVAVESGGGFDPERALNTLQQYEVTHTFLPPSALRMLRTSEATETQRSFPDLRLVLTGGESLDPKSQTWSESYFGATVHEGYGSTEMFNHIIGDCTALEPADNEWMGYVLPGHKVTLLDTETGQPVDVGEPGEIALHREDPVLFEGYLNRSEATKQAYDGEWYLSGDIAVQNQSGQFRFIGRKDDLIISSGYRIGPDEIEDVLSSHDAVAATGVVGIPDDQRGQVPKAFIVLAPGYSQDSELRESLQQYVRNRLAKYEYPREIAFVDSLPRTITGKVKRNAIVTEKNIRDDEEY